MSQVVEKLERRIAALEERVSHLQLEIAGCNQRIQDAADALSRAMVWAQVPGKRP